MVFNNNILADFPAVFVNICNFDICHDKYKIRKISVSFVGQSTTHAPLQLKHKTNFSPLRSQFGH